MKTTPAPSVIVAKDASPAALAAARVRAAGVTPFGPLGPINPPMLLIVSGAAAVQGAPRSAAAAAWKPSFRVVAGLAASYGQTLVERGTRTTTSRHAFAAAILDGDVFLTINHDESLRLASRLGGSLRLHETDSGLYFEANPFATRDAQRIGLYARVERGEFVGASIRYGSERRQSDNGARTMTRAAYLIEVSLITRDRRPRDPHTWVAIETPGERTHMACSSCRQRGGFGLRDLTQRGLCGTCHSKSW